LDHLKEIFCLENRGFLFSGVVVLIVTQVILISKQFEATRLLSVAYFFCGNNGTVEVLAQRDTLEKDSKDATYSIRQSALANKRSTPTMSDATCHSCARRDGMTTTTFNVKAYQ
jgi:hypothetical protein